MPKKRHWTDVENAKVMRMIADGASSRDIADTMGISLTSVRRQCEALGSRRFIKAEIPRGRTPVPAKVDAWNDPHRPPFPAGHKETWGRIVHGTCLADMEYPVP